MKKGQTFTLTPEVSDFITKVSERTGTSRSATVCRIITEYALAATALEPVLAAALASSPTARLLADHAQAIKDEWSTDNGSR